MIDLKKIEISRPNTEIYHEIRKKWDALSKPIDGLGDFEKVICEVGAIQGRIIPDLTNKAVVIMCADNGVVEEGVSQCGSEVTLAVAKLIGEGKSTINNLAKRTGAKIIAVDVGIDCDEEIPGVIQRKVAKGTKNFCKEPAMTLEQAINAIEIGIDIVKELADEGINIIATGEMGIGNTTTATALLCSLLGIAPELVTGRGAGLDDEGLERKKMVISGGLSRYKNNHDELCKLASLGGFDIAALVGLYIGGAIYHIPIIIDGLISVVAALISEYLVPGCREYMIASHNGREKGIESILCKLNLAPLINGNMALGEATGAVMLFPLLDMALDLYKSGESFSSAGIESYSRF